MHTYAFIIIFFFRILVKLGNRTLCVTFWQQLTVNHTDLFQSLLYTYKWISHKQFQRFYYNPILCITMLSTCEFCSLCNKVAAVRM
jgi:hypothetical protein